MSSLRLLSTAVAVVAVLIGARSVLANVISFVRVGDNTSVSFEQQTVLVPHSLLRDHLIETNRLHTWWFDNKIEAAKFRAIARVKPSANPMTVERAVEQRFRRERAKIISFLEFYRDADSGRSPDDLELTLLRALADKINPSHASQTNIVVINRLFSKLIDDLFARKSKSSSRAVGTIPHSVLKSYFRQPPAFDFVTIPSGGSLKSFELQKYELTQHDWFVVMGTNPSFFSGREDCADTHLLVQGTELCPKFPVETFRFAELRVLLRKMAFQQSKFKVRVPTNAEWEYAARAGTTTTYSFGEDVSKLAEYALSHQTFASHPIAVGSLTPNPWGLFDMHGNVYEFVQNDPKPTGTSAKKAGLIIRGGSWFNRAETVGSAHSYIIYDEWTCYDVGIRLAR